MGRKKKKKGAEAPNPVGLPPLPLPPTLPGAVPPPPAGGIPPPPTENLPTPAPIPESRGVLEGASAPKISSLAPPDMSKDKKKDGYDSLWKRGSSKPLQQVYGHIDRLGEGEVGSLLDRYADRFGHQLDREIIVKRKAEHDSKLAEIRDAPTIELLDEDDEEEEIDAVPVDEETTEEESEHEPEEEIDEGEESEHELDEETLATLNSRKSSLESEIRKLKPKYKLAKQKNQANKLKKLKPILESLLSERKAIAAVISGDAPLSSLEEEEEIEEVVEEDTAGDSFIEFVSIIDNLLTKLPDPDSFIRSDDFKLYAEVAGNPGESDNEQRVEFWAMIDSLLLELPDEEIKSFMESEDFAIYSEIGSIYGS